METSINENCVQEIAAITRQIEASSMAASQKAHAVVRSIITRMEKDSDYFTEVIRYLENSFIDENGYHAGKAWSSFLAAWLLLKRGETDKALSAFQHILPVFTEYNDAVGVARTTNGIGVCLMYQSNFTLAIEHFSQTLTISQEIDFEEGISIASSNLGIVYYELHNFDEAEQYLVQSLKFQDILPNNKVIVQSYRASIMVEQNRIKDAYTLFLECLETCKTYGFVYSEIDIQNRFAVLLEKRDPEKAISLLKASYAQAKSLNNPRLIAQCAMLLAKQLFKTNDFQESMHYCMEAITIASTDNISNLIIEGKALAAQIHAEQNNWQQAYATLLESYEQEKQLFNEKLIAQSFIAHQHKIELEKNQYELEIKRLRLISETGTLIAGAMDTRTIGSIIYSKLRNLMPINAFGLAVYNQQKSELAFEYFIENETEGEPFTMHINNKDSLAAYCIRNNEDIIINNIFKEYSKYVEKTQYVALDNNEPVYSLMFCPIHIGTSVKGVLTAQARPIGAYKKHHLETLHALAAYAGVAIQNTKLFHDIQLLASTDPLTGIANRRKFMDVFFMELERASRYGTTLSFLMFDIDFFKRINDTYGHSLGDIVLQKAAALARANLRTTDTIGRYGGEEFTILLPNTHLEGAKIVAERIRISFENAEVEAYPGKTVVFTASFGLAEYQDGDTMDSLLARSDRALYYAKETGRNKVAWER